MTAIDQTLARVFGYTDFRPGQRSVIETVVAGRSAAAIFPTGSGKSLCYQLPALHLPHLTLVVSPLLALMQDQLAFLERHGVPAARLDSSQDKDEARAVMDAVARGETRVLMISVERLKNERFRAFIRRVPISLLVVDEAHCISEWGHNFRPDYLTLPATRRALDIPQTLLLTATATPRVIEDMRRHFAIESRDVTATGFYRPNLDLQISPVTADERPRRLVEWLQPRLNGPGSGASVIYVTLQQTAEQLAAYLVAAKLPAAAYHAGLDADTRAQRQDDFMAGRTPVIVATIAFGMGIDKADIRCVVHYDLPKSVENYSQEIGRAGRDGGPAECLMLAARDHLNVLENFTYGDTPERAAIERVTATLPAPGDDWRFTLNTLSRDSDIRPLPLKTLLVHLELEGVIRPRFSYFAEYRFRLEEPIETLTARFQGERRAFVEAIVEASPKARTWHHLDLDILARLGTERSLETSRQRVVTALDYLADKGLITLESKQMTEVYTVLRPVDDALVSTLHQAFVDKEYAEIERLHAMLALFEGEGCLTRRLADWFGDTQAPQQCGHCSGCRHQPAQWPALPPLPPLEGQDAEALTAPLHERLVAAGQHEAATPTLFARFLCGLTSPRLTRHRARQLPGFAALEAYPFGEVRDWLNA